MSTNLNDLKAAIAAKLKANEGKNSPGHLSTGIISNANNIAEVKNPYLIVSEPVTINATKPKLPGNVLEPSNSYDVEAKKIYLANLKISDPAKYKQEFAKQQYLDYQKELVKGYEASNIERDKRRSK